MVEKEPARQQVNPIVEARESSISSLKELIIILTALTIATGFGVAIHSVHRFFKNQSAEYMSIWMNYFHQLSEDEIGNISRLILLIVCVLRFHHGNLMFLDKHYVLAAKHGNKRNLFFDFFSILAMSIGFSGMGFTTFSPILFNTAYMFILVVSVIWTTISVWHEITNGTSAKEVGEQFVWCIINWITLFFFAPIYFLMTPVHKAEILAVVVLVNSALDIGVNWKRYFPKAA